MWAFKRVRRQWREGKITFNLGRVKRVVLLRRRYRGQGIGGGDRSEEGDARENAETRPLLG